jgi:phage regulator Rha-like protein
MGFNPLFESVDILVKDRDSLRYGYEFERVQSILEDANSPITKKYQEKLFQSVIDKGHIDFGDIPKSAGNIKAYKGYNNMVETLTTLNSLAIDQKNNTVIEYTSIVQKAISNIEQLSSTYSKGFISKTDYVILEYNTYVYTCVEATTTLLYTFVDYMKRPDQDTMTITLSNSTLRADLFYIEQLKKFNNVNDKMGIDYRKMLESLCSKGKNNFLGAEMVIGIAAVSVAAMAIVPITRELIYRFYHLRGSLSKSLEMQASFLEMNAACIQSNEVMTAEKKKKVLDKQLKLKNRLMKLSDFLKVKGVKSSQNSARDIKASNKMLTLDNLQADVSSSPIEFI